MEVSIEIFDFVEKITSDESLDSEFSANYNIMLTRLLKLIINYLNK